MDQNELNRQDKARELYIEHIKSCADFSKELVRYCFLINGAAVTAIIASDKFIDFKFPVFIFSIGAFFAVIGGAIAYYYQNRVAYSWKRYMTNKDTKEKEIDLFWKASFAFLLLSMLTFLFALGCAANNLLR